MCKISVIVPVYNVEKYLTECLNSIVNQTLKDIEIICIDDGSTDNSGKILDEYALNDNRIKVVHKENGGYGKAMNSGLSIATGEFIGIVEPDDYADLTMYENLYKLASQHNADIVKSDYYENHTALNIIKKAGLVSSNNANKVLNISKFPYLIRIQPSLWTAIYKKDFLQKNNVNFLETPGASYQDTSFTFKAMSLAQRVVLTTDAYIYYRMDNENSSVNSTGKVYMVNNEFDEITRFLNANPDIKAKINLEKLIKQYMTYKWNLIRIDKKFAKDYIEAFSKTFRDYYSSKEITNKFFKKVNKREFFLLINNPLKFYENLDKIIEAENQRLERRKKFSVRIRTSGISIVLFGKQIIGKH